MTIRVIAYQAYLVMLSLGLLVLGAFTGLDFLLQTSPGINDVLILPDASLLLILLGLLLVGCVWQRFRLTWLSGSGALALCFYSIAHNLLVGGQARDSLLSGLSRMHSMLALLISLAVIALLSMYHLRFRLPAKIFGAVLIISIPLQEFAQGLELIPALTAEPNFTRNMLAGLLVILMGLATISLSGIPQGARPRLSRVTLLTAAICALFAAASWFSISRHEQNELQRSSQTALDAVEKNLKSMLLGRLQLIQRLGERLELVKGFPDKALWDTATNSYLRDFPNIRFIALHNGDGEEILAKTRDSLANSWKQRLLKEDYRIRVHHEHETDDDISNHHSQVILGEQKESHSLLIMPIHGSGTNTQLYLLAGLDLGGTLKEALGSDLYNFHLRVFRASEPVYGAPADSTSTHLVSQRSLVLDHDEQWRIEIMVDRHAAVTDSNYLATLMLCVISLLGVLLIISQCLFGLARQRNLDLLAAKQKLEKSIEHQQSLQNTNQMIMKHSMDMLCSFDAHSRFIMVSESCRDILGYGPDELIGKANTDFALPEDREMTLSMEKKIQGNHSTRDFRNRYRHKNGSTVDMMWSAVWSDQDQQTYCVGRDISQLVVEQNFAARQREILTLISQAEPLQKILEKICYTLEERFNGYRVSVMLLKHDTGTLTCLAAPSMPKDYSAQIEDLDVGENQGSCGTAAFRKEPVLVENIDDSALWGSYRALASAHNLKACWSWPLITSQGETLGTFALYAPMPGLPDNHQRRIIEVVCQLTGLAVERELGRLRLSESEQQYRSLFSYNPDPVFSLNTSGAFTSINDAGLDLVELGNSEYQGMHFSALVHPEDLTRTADHFAAALQGQSQRYPLRIFSTSGTLLELDVTNLPIKVNDQVVGVFGIAKDLRGYNKAQRELQSALTRSGIQSERMRRLKEVAVKIAGLWDSENLYDFLALQVRDIVGAHQAVLSLTQGADWSQSISAVSSSDKYAAWRDYEGTPDGSGIYAIICESNAPLRLTQKELEAHPRWNGFGSNAPNHPPMNGWLAVPLVSHKGTNLGLLQLSDKLVGNFDEEDEYVAMQFAQMTVAALENMQLVNNLVSADKELRSQLSFTSSVTNSLYEGLLAVDDEQVIRFSNPRALQLLGAREGALDGTPLNAVLPKIFSTKLNASYELEHSSEGHQYLLDCRISPLWGDSELKGRIITLRDITATRASEKALFERDQFFSLSREMFCMINLQGFFVQVNTAFIQVLGYQADELIEAAYIEFVFPADRALAETAINELVKGEHIDLLDLRLRHANGRYLRLEVAAVMGTDRLIYVVARDVTEHRTAQETLARHQMLFKIAGQIARIGGWVIDIRKQQLLLSEEVSAIHNISVGNTIELEHIYRLYDPAYHSLLRQSLEDCVATGQAYEVKAQALVANGDRVWVRISGVPLLDPEGRVTHIQGALQDISAEIEANENIDNLARRMHNILESITDAFFALDSQWRFSYMNPQAENLMQLNASDALGKVIWDLFPEAKGTTVYEHYHSVLLSGDTQHFEVFFERLGIWLEISAYPAEEGISVYFRDIGERKEAQRQLQHMLVELERSNRDLQDFALIASHDLQEPLRKIQAFGERLGQRIDLSDEPAQDYLSRMRHAAGRMQTLIQDLLTYSRVTTRGEALKPVRLDNVVDEVLLDLEAALENSRARVEREPLFTIDGDARQLGQVIQNLISNAIKFQPENQAPLIRIFQNRGPDGRLSICLSDNGIGFDEKYLDRIYNPFQRLHDRTRYAGTGIGLAIVKKIVERHQAEISATSRPNHGTTFKITFARSANESFLSPEAIA